MITLLPDLTRLSIPSRSPYVLHALNVYTGARRKRGTTVTGIPREAKEREGYSSYLLRLWRVEDAARPMWRASLKSVHSGEQMGFASLEDLFHFLRTRTGTVWSADGDRQEPS
jgi:hypothetical protein